MNPLEDNHLIELASLAMAARSTYKAQAEQARRQVQDVILELEQLRVKLAAVEAQLERETQARLDAEHFNKMLQKMLTNKKKE
jgi:hypothetical protein